MQIPDSPDIAARRNVAASVELNRRQLDADYGGSTSRSICSLGIVGAGIMGAAIGAAAAGHGLSVVLTDTQPTVLASILQRISSQPRRDGLPMEPATIRGRIQTTPDLAALGRCDLVLESVVENPAIKRQIYAQLEPLLSDGAVLASNTSTIPIARLANGLADPERFCGIHFFHPLHERPLVEIISGPKTRRETVASAVGFVRRIGKVPLVVGDGPGFVVNRLMMPYVGEGMQLLLEGATVEAVDQAGEEFGMALGPLRLLDQIGLDTALDCGWSFCGAFPDTVPNSPLLVAMVKARRLGRKSGAGFYAYVGADPDSAVARHDPAVDVIIARWADAPRPHSPDSITSRLLLPMLLEATRVLESGAVHNPRSIDLGVILGLGFPEWRGGLLYWADTLGVGKALEMLQQLKPLGSRSRPTALLVEMAKENRRFYD
jgi:3-hydroxyacyl-CoA dehydrogenase